MAEILVLQHHPAESPGLLAEILEAKGHTLRLWRSYEDEPLPLTLDEFAGLMVLGGPMGVYEQDQHPHLSAELQLIRRAMHTETPVLGICLGSQLIAAALGATVARAAAREIGWYPVQLLEASRTDPLWKFVPQQFTAFHWHGDAFPLPAGCTALASSALTPVQAFRYAQNVYGILFHLEVTLPILEGMVADFGEEPIRLHQSASFLELLNPIGRAVFGAWAELLRS